MNMKTKTPAIFIGILFLTGCQNLKEVDTTVYMDPSRPVEERVEALLEQMTLEEKIGQMDMVSEWDQDSIMKAGYYDFGAWIAGQEPEAANLLQSFSEKTRLKIPYLIGMDAAHGYATLQGRTIYPTSVSMAATFNRSLTEQAARKLPPKYGRPEPTGPSPPVWTLSAMHAGDAPERPTAKILSWPPKWCAQL